MVLHYIGYRVKYLQPPPLPSNHVNRQILLDEIATKLLQATSNHNTCGTTLTITGAGGYGKTTIVTSLCYHPIVKEHFTDGFVFIELGPQATDPNFKLRTLYNLLTNKHCDHNVAEEKVKELTIAYYRNLLVIIDDVWDTEVAGPFVKAFSNCKTILTTRMNNIEQYIPCNEVITVGQMTKNEALCLLTSEVIDNSTLLQEDAKLLDELAQDVDMWPLLLSLLRGQLSHNLKTSNVSFHKATQNVQAKLRCKGLTAFDKNNLGDVKKVRKLAVKSCIEITLELLQKSVSDRLKSLILWTGIGAPLETAVLGFLWKVSSQEANHTVEVLWMYGLVQFTDITVTPNGNIKHCVEVHSVISKYIIECMDSNEICSFSPQGGKLDVVDSVNKVIILSFQQSCGIHNPLSLTAMDYLKYKLSEIENISLPLLVKGMNSQTVIDPHHVMLGLQCIKDALMNSPDTIKLLSLLGEEIDSLITDSQEIFKDTHKLCRVLNQGAQRNLYERNYGKLIQTVEEFIKNYPLCNVAQKAVSMVKKIMSYCNDELLKYMMERCEYFQMKTYNYHPFSTLLLPYIKLEITFHEKITDLVLNGSSDHKIDELCYYFRNGDYQEEYEPLEANHYIKLQEVAPNYVHQQVSQM